MSWDLYKPKLAKPKRVRSMLSDVLQEAFDGFLK